MGAVYVITVAKWRN